jgi:hypothetical protein
MFFQNRSRRAFLEGPGGDLASIGRFWCHFRFSEFPKRRLIGAMFAQSVYFCCGPFPVWASLPRPATQNGATTPRDHIFIDFELIFNGAWFNFIKLLQLSMSDILIFESFPIGLSTLSAPVTDGRTDRNVCSVHFVIQFTTPVQWHNSLQGRQ